MGTKDRKTAETATAPAAQPVVIEELFARHELAAWQQRGVMVKAGWKPGKAVTEDEFLSALADWRRSR